MPRLGSTPSGWSRLKTDIAAILSSDTGTISARAAIVKSILLRSVRISFGSSSRNGSPIALLPLRIRPAFVLLNVLDLIFLGLLGFHPSGQAWIRLNDKILHFVCFFFATALFYMIWDVDDSARGSWIWRNASLVLTFTTCFFVGGIGSEIVQSLLPYKEFQLGDIIANLLGSSLGLFISYHVELRIRARREIERLYAPLDIEDYGDLDEGDDWNDSIAGRQSASRRSHQKTTQASSGLPSADTGKKKVRFGSNDIWDDSVDIQASRFPASSQAVSESQASQSTATTYPPTRATAQPSPQQHQMQSAHVAVPVATSSKSAREDLFTIDDEDDDEQDSPRNDAAQT